MNNKTKKELIKGVVLIIFIGVLSLLLILNILYPAYLSYSVACGNPIEFIPFNQTINITIAGQTTLTETGEIEVELFSEDKDVKKHELIHVKQFESGFPKIDCEFSHYLAEVEAYAFEDLPDKLFIFIYGDYKEII